jgi:SAM-dependent methyltransferase
VTGGFDPALAGAATGLELADGRRVPLPVRRWRAAAAGADHWMLDRCAGPTLDLGCGPGRLVAALRAAGVPALGVDHSHRAVRLCRERGAPAVRGDLFARLPGEGGWRHALLADGNIGIGGDPAVLLRRAAALVAPGGSVLVETAGDGLWRGRARLLGTGAGGGGPWFPWATVGLAALPALARSAGLRVAGALHCGERGIAQLVRDAGHG